MTETVKARVQRIMADSDPHRKGRSFEEFLARHLKDIPDAEVARAWRWSAVPPEIRRHAVSSAHGGQDFGIDVLAVRNDGGFIAVQAKAYAKTALTKSDVQKFLAASNLHQALTHRWIVATGKVTDPVRTMVGAQCSIINPLVAWGDVILPEVGSRPTLKPDAIQRRAIGDCVTGLGNAGEGHDRGRLIMACGLGKTLVSQRIAEQIAFEGNRAAPLVLYATPSISLTAQSRRSWLRNSECGLQTVVVCSDKDAGRHYDESVAEFVEAPVSTAPEAIAKSLTAMIGRAKGKMTAVFCTYQSIDKVIEAQQIANVTVDFAVADEAHNTTGNIGGGGGGKEETGNFRKFHHELKARKRLYQTATPRIYRSTHKRGEARIVDMSDEEVYGPELHKTTFRDALDSDTERLCDYRVIAIIREAGAESFAASGTGGTSVAPIPPKPIQSKAAALARAMYAVRAGNDDEGYHDPVSLRSCIAYTRTIRNARWLGQTLSQCAASRFARRAVERDEMIARDPHRPITAGHITGAHSQSVRVAELDRLGMARDENGRHVTANCKVLSEGVDVPALDAVAFLEPKKSVVEIIQAVGRVMRKPPGSDKSIGYVVVPIAIDRQSGDLRLDLQEEVEHMSGDWKTLGMVLQALKSHDPYLDDKISEHLLVDFVESKGSSSSGGGGTDHVWDHTELSQWFFEQAIPVLVEKSGIRPDAKDIAHWMQGTVKAVARHLYAERLGSIAAATLEIGIPRNPGEEQEKALMKACETAALIMVQASVMHHRIQSNHPDLVDEPLQGMSEIMRASNPGGMMLRDLNTLLARDFAPVLKPCERLVAAMTASNPGPGFSRAIRLIAENAGEHADDYARAGEDRAGAVFQRAMQNPSATGAYYTLPTAAILLAELACEAMRPEDKPWENASTDVSHLQILDPACGTGTLLNAMKEAIVGRMVGTARSQTAKALVEDSIVGLDVDTHALQLAATQLTLNSLDADYRRMNLWRMPYGASGSREPTLGSLELMVHQYLPQGDLLPDSPTPIAADAVRTKGHLVFLRDKLLHGRTGAILTNPPYSVGGKQARHMTKAERSVVQNRQKQLRAGIKDRASSGTARVIDTDSLSPFFSVMIEDMLREGGVLAKICPLTALTSVSGKGERAFFLRHFDVLYVVTCHRKDFNFSVDVGIHEALLVMRRREAGRRRAPATRFLSLSRQPRDADEARRFAQFVATGRGKPCGTIHHRDRAHLIRGRWTPVFYEDPGLANKADWMEDHAANQPGLVLLGDVYAPNATGQTLRGNTWSFCDVGDPQSDTDVLWSASNKVQRTL